MRAEARRRGVSFAKVKNERLHATKGVTYRQNQEERRRAQKIRNIRQMSPEVRGVEAPWVQADPEAWGQFPVPQETPETLGTGTEPHGFQGPFGPSPMPDWDFYWPTRTINPPRPRTLQARYSQSQHRLEVIFRDGTPWTYFEVPPGIWTRFKRVRSPGQYINSVLNGYPYGRGGWGSIVGE
jgi:hypothetical protein